MDTVGSRRSHVWPVQISVYDNEEDERAEHRGDSGARFCAERKFTKAPVYMPALDMRKNLKAIDKNLKAIDLELLAVLWKGNVSQKT